MKLPLLLCVALWILNQGCLQVRPLMDDAWWEANRRAGTSAQGQDAPEVEWRVPQTESGRCLDPALHSSRSAARYLPDLDRVEILSLCAQPLHTVLVHEFLHAIRERARRDRGELLEGYEPEGEAWVQERSAGR